MKMGSNEDSSKLPPPGVLSVMRALYPGVSATLSGEKPKARKSLRRTRGELISIIIRNWPFGKMQSKLLKALASPDDYLDRVDIKIATGTKVPKALIRDVRRKIEEDEHLSKIIAISYTRKNGKRGYHLNFSPSKK